MFFLLLKLALWPPTWVCGWPLTLQVQVAFWFAESLHFSAVPPVSLHSLSRSWLDTQHQPAVKRLACSFEHRHISMQQAFTSPPPFHGPTTRSKESLRPEQKQRLMWSSSWVSWMWKDLWCSILIHPKLCEDSSVGMSRCVEGGLSWLQVLWVRRNLIVFSPTHRKPLCSSGRHRLHQQHKQQQRWDPARQKSGCWYHHPQTDTKVRQRWADGDWWWWDGSPPDYTWGLFYILFLLLYLS